LHEYLERWSLGRVEWGLERWILGRVEFWIFRGFQ